MMKRYLVTLGLLLVPLVCDARAEKDECAPNSFSHAYVKAPTTGSKIEWALFKVGDLPPDPRLPHINGARTLAEYYAHDGAATAVPAPPQEAKDLFGDCPDTVVNNPNSKVKGLACIKTPVWRLWSLFVLVGSCEYTQPGISGGGPSATTVPVK